MQINFTQASPSGPGLIQIKGLKLKTMSPVHAESFLISIPRRRF